MTHTALSSAIVLALVLSAGVATRSDRVPPADEWRTFEGTWSAVGHRQTVPTEGRREAAVVELAGAVILLRPADWSDGFLSQTVGFDDGGSITAGRVVWTDARGDHIFSVLNGEPIETGRRMTGTITGGTGKYAGIAGDFELTWQYVVAGEDDLVQGRALDLQGRFRMSTPRQ